MRAKFKLAEISIADGTPGAQCRIPNTLKLTDGVAKRVNSHAKFSENRAVYAGTGCVPTKRAQLGLTRHNKRDQQLRFG